MKHGFHLKIITTTKTTIKKTNYTKFNPAKEQEQNHKNKPRINTELLQGSSKLQPSQHQLHHPRIQSDVSETSDTWLQSLSERR